MDGAPMVALRGVSKSFDRGATFAVRDVTLEVARGELVALVGGSGSGKTTTLKMINRLVEPTRGKVFVDGKDVSASNPVLLRRRIGYVFQQVGLFPHMTIAANIGVGLRLAKASKAQRRERVDELLDLVGLPPAEYRDRAPAQLSGGQRQRVGVARALATKPSLMLMDEPLGALDPITRDALQEELRRLHQRLGLTIVLVTHDMTEALLLADRIVVMRDGAIEGVGAPAELLASPGTEYVRSLVETPRAQAERLAALGHGQTREAAP